MNIYLPKLSNIINPIYRTIVAKTKKERKIVTGICLASKDGNLIFRDILTNNKYSLGKGTSLVRILD